MIPELRLGRRQLALQCLDTPASATQLASITAAGDPSGAQANQGPDQ